MIYRPDRTALSDFCTDRSRRNVMAASTPRFTIHVRSTPTETMFTPNPDHAPQPSYVSSYYTTNLADTPLPTTPILLFF